MEVKEPKDYIEQLNKLKTRGCIIGDENYDLRTLKRINYYRIIQANCIYNNISE